MYCDKFECCNVAACHFNEKLCKVGYYGEAYKHTDDGNNKLHLVKRTGLWQTSKTISFIKYQSITESIYLSISNEQFIA